MIYVCNKCRIVQFLLYHSPKRGLTEVYTWHQTYLHISILRQLSKKHLVGLQNIRTFAPDFTDVKSPKWWA